MAAAGLQVVLDRCPKILAERTSAIGKHRNPLERSSVGVSGRHTLCFSSNLIDRTDAAIGGISRVHRDIRCPENTSFCGAGSAAALGVSAVSSSLCSKNRCLIYDQAAYRSSAMRRSVICSAVSRQFA